MAVPNIILIILLVAIPVIIFFISFLALVVFQTPMDRFQGWIPKIVVLLGLTLAGCVILCLPFDVWNVTQKGHLEDALPIIWQVLFAVVAVFVVIVLPFVFFYYESYDSERTPLNNIAMQTLYGIIAAGIIAAIVALVVGVSYIFLGYAQIPVTYYISPEGQDTRPASVKIDLLNKGTYKYDTYDVRMSFIVYAITILSICGWVPFAICGGCGMSSLPLICMLQCFQRPTTISDSEFFEQQQIFADKAEKLIRVGMKLEQERKDKYKNMGRAKHAKLRKQFKEAVLGLENKYKILLKRTNIQKFDWLYYVFTFIIGLVAFAVTAIWVAHIIIYKVTPTPMWPFLNIFFMWLDSYVFPIFGLILYGIFAFYLMLAVIFGNIAIMSRLPLVSVYPIKYKDTMLTSFIFNTGLLLLVSLAIVQFCTDEFSAYARGTAISSMFNVYICYTKYIGYVLQYIHYAFLVFILLGVLVSFINACIPTREQKELDEILSGSV